ncbi:hypothetical protein TELCIR_00160 [Teladorsagia circumcincta]|uniref:Uncharacterized protein n=1 Tax=Teladorsagia circumcincta TaxID=45464 RepID=A0A2G9V5K6_TELCI|nr:hypothetical protein TELCIR_00160 [Teladorsagia circumcincta]
MGVFTELNLSAFGLVAFRSSVLHQPTSGIVGDAKTDIVSIGLNADETLLGVFGHTPQGCFVYIFDVLTLSVDVTGEAFPISTVRIGNSASKGLAFEWNPAVADMFAASDTFFAALNCCLLNATGQNSSKYTMVGEKKLEGNVSEISWSPKGKQLLVRTTNAPENGGSVVVINLSWLSTTDWVVAYSNAEMTTTAVFMLSIKKDKPPSWTPLNFPPQSSLGVTRRLLVDWNLALVLSPSSPDLVAICKLTNSNAWVSTSIASLPQPSNAKFAIGVAVDLSNQNMVAIGGLPAAVDVSKIRNGVRLTTAAAATPSVITQAPMSIGVAPQPAPFLGAFGTKKNELPAQPSATSSFGMFGGTQAQHSMTIASVTPTQNTSTVGGLSLSAANTDQKPLSGTMFTGFQGLATTANTATLQTAATPPTGLTTPGKVFTGIGARTPEAKPVISSAASAAQKPLTTTPIKQDAISGADSAEATRKALAAARASAIKSIETFNSDWHDFHELLHSFHINMQKVEDSVNEAVNSLSHSDNLETVEEIRQMVIELDDEMQDMLAMLSERKVLVDEKTALAKECKGSQVIFGPAVDRLEIASPVRVKPVLSTRNASTQADAPAQAQPKLVAAASCGAGSSNIEKKDEKPLSIFGVKEAPAPVSEEKKEEKQTSLFGTTAAAGSEKKDEKLSSLFGGLGSVSAEKKEEKPSSLFGSLGTAGTVINEKKDEKPTSLFGGLGSSGEKKEEKASSLFGGGTTTLNPEKKEEKQPSVFGGSSLSAAAEKSDDKPTSLFGGLGFAAAAASAAATADTDEGMDDDGVAGGTSQAAGSIFGGGFMRC